MLAVGSALAASVAIGIVDYAAGIQSRRWGVLAVLTMTQVAGFVLLLAVAVISAPPIPESGAFWAYAALAGTAQVVGVAALFRGLATGVMSVVAPIAAASAVIPILVAVASGDQFTGLRTVGLAAALFGAVLVAYVPDRTSSGGHVVTGAGFGLLAALAIGCMYIGLDGAATSSEPVAATVVMRAVTLFWLALPAYIGRSAVRAAGARFGVLCMIGFLEVGAIFLFLAATLRESIAVAAALTALHPVTTIALAHITLREHMVPSQWIGVCLALGGVTTLAST